MEIPRSWKKASKANIFKTKYEVDLLRVSITEGFFKPMTFHIRVMDIFYNNKVTIKDFNGAIFT